VSTVPASVITGDVGVSPIDQGALTGFSIILDSTGLFATSTQVTGSMYAADFSAPTPTKMTAAISDMELAYTDAAGRVDPDYVEYMSGLLGGTTLGPGVYKFGTGVGIYADCYLNGAADDTWIFQIAGIGDPRTLHPYSIIVKACILYPEPLNSQFLSINPTP
jgi:hypothetical protein